MKEHYKCVEAIGFIKHAFILSFFYLAKMADKTNGQLTYAPNLPTGQSFYFEAVREVISLGGDTDTNACIVGGIVGAHYGIQMINESLLEKFFTYINVKADIQGGKGRKRAEWLDMGRNTLDCCFWLHIMRFQSDQTNQGKIPETWNDIVRIPDDEPIKN